MNPQTLTYFWKIEKVIQQHEQHKIALPTKKQEILYQNPLVAKHKQELFSAGRQSES